MYQQGGFFRRWQVPITCSVPFCKSQERKYKLTVTLETRRKMFDMKKKKSAKTFIKFEGFWMLHALLKSDSMNSLSSQSYLVQVLNSQTTATETMVSRGV